MHNLVLCAQPIFLLLAWMTTQRGDKRPGDGAPGMMVSDDDDDGKNQVII